MLNRGNVAGDLRRRGFAVWQTQAYFDVSGAIAPERNQASHLL
jgi:hypothetical protein